MRGRVSFLALSLMVACSQEAPTETEETARGLGLAAAEVAAEEEVLGGVYSNGVVPSSSTMWVRLVPLGGGAALVDANGNPAPSSADRMPIKLQGSRFPAKTTTDGQWGWYDPEAGDGPCRSNAPDKSEVHDINKNNIPDGNEGGGIEKHCLKPGAYRVELLSSQNGSLVQSREIDKVRVSGSIGQKGIENPTLTSGGPTNVADVFVHFDIGGASYTVSGAYTVDNATTSAVNDTTGTSADFFRFDAQHATSWPGTTRGELLAKYNWGDARASRYSTTDQVIRAQRWPTSQTFSILADVIQPRGTGISGQLRKVIVQNADDAAGISHTLPGTITVGQFVATSVTMKNTGSNTWTTGTYKLAQSPLWIWTPTTVALSSSVASGATKTFNFNETTFEPEFAGTTQDNFWQMKKNTAFFGARIGRGTFVKASGSLALGSILDRFLAWLGPPTAWARIPVSFFDLQDEPVQTIRKLDYPLDTAELRSEGRTSIQYVSSLAEPWPVDFTLHLQFDPSVFEIGQVVRGIEANGYDVSVDIRGWDVTIKGTRNPGAALGAGEGLILEVPLVLKASAGAPATLPLVELIVTE